jgi:hypothetical protein
MSDKAEMNDKRYRVAQRGKGHSGMASLRALIEHPNFDLVGVKVYADTQIRRPAAMPVSCVA